MNKLFLVIALLFNFAAAYCEESENIFKDISKINDPFKLKDPFSSKRLRLKRKKVKVSSVAKVDGVYSNVSKVENSPIDELKIVGVIVGKDRRALAQTKKGGQTYILREGMKFGKDGAEIKAIVPGGVILVEKIVNVYGQNEYLETVIPISQ